MLLETILYVTTVLFCLDSMKYCFQRRTSPEWVPIVIPSTVCSHSLDIDQVAPLTEENPEESCSICLEPLQTIRYKRKTQCGHIFCSECLHEWFHKRHSCPLCNQTFS